MRLSTALWGVILCVVGFGSGCGDARFVPAYKTQTSDAVVVGETLNITVDATIRGPQEVEFYLIGASDLVDLEFAEMKGWELFHDDNELAYSATFQPDGGGLQDVTLELQGTCVEVGGDAIGMGYAVSWYKSNGDWRKTILDDSWATLDISCE